MGYEAGERDIKEQADLIIKQREAIEVLMSFAVMVRGKTYADSLCTEEANAMHTTFYKESREFIIKSNEILSNTDSSKVCTEHLGSCEDNQGEDM